MSRIDAIAWAVDRLLTHDTVPPEEVLSACAGCGDYMADEDLLWESEDEGYCDDCQDDHREEIPTAADRNGGAYGFNRRMGLV